MKKLRIAVVHSFYDRSQPSGETSAVEDQIVALREAGHDVLLVGRETDLEKGKAFFASRSAARVASGRGFAPQETLELFKPDIVHLHNTFPNWSTRWTSRWGKRLVVTLHNVRPFCAAATFFRDGDTCTDCLATPVLPAIRHKCYTGSRLRTVPVALATRPGGPLRWPFINAASVLVLNDRVRDLVSPLTSASVEVVPNFSATAGGAGEGSVRSGWVYAGRLSPEKGIEWLLDHWPASERLSIVGTGPLESRVGSWSASRPHVKFLGAVPRGQVLELIRTARGVIIPSLCQEGFPTVALEGMAVGTPSLISTRVAAASSLAKSGVAVSYSPESKDEGIQSALRWVVDQGSMSLEARCREVFESEYSREAWLDRVARIYSRVVESSG